jgi:hypothetical protein
LAGHAGRIDKLTRLHELRRLPDHEQDTMLLGGLRISRLAG